MPTKREAREGFCPYCGQAQMVEAATDEIDALQELGNLITYDNIESAVIRLADSTVTIKQTKEGVSVARKKALSVKLEA